MKIKPYLGGAIIALMLLAQPAIASDTGAADAKKEDTGQTTTKDTQKHDNMMMRQMHMSMFKDMAGMIKETMGMIKNLAHTPTEEQKKRLDEMMKKMDDIVKQHEDMMSKKMSK